MAFSISSRQLPRPSIDSNVTAGADDVEDGETIESLENKLAIERRVQYGAEKMLDVIEKKDGGADGAEQAKVKANITAQLEAANEHIKSLEAKLERLRGTPQRPRRRPQARLHGYPSSSSLNPLSSSHSSNVLLSAQRPRVLRQHSNLTPERDREDGSYFTQGFGTPSKGLPRMGTSSTLASSSGGSGNRPRSRSAGEDVLSAGSSWDQSSGVLMEDDDTSVLLDSAKIFLRRLKEIGRGKGKERAVDNGAEELDALTRLGDMLKKSEALRLCVELNEVVQGVLPSLGDSSTPKRRAAAYRILRYILTRESWAKMLSAGIEWLLIRSFTRDAKAVHEREQVLRLIRSVIVLPPPSLRPTSSPVRSRSHSQSHSYSRPNSGSIRTGVNGDREEGFVAVVMENKVPLTDGIVRAVVSVAENPDDAMRTICMETLLEIGLLDLECLVRSNAFRTVLLTFKDGPAELGPAITGLLLFLVNKPSTRELLLPGSDLETVLVGLTEAYGKIPTRLHGRHLENLEQCVANIGMILASWPGLLYMCMDDCRAIKSLISSLHVPNADMRNALLNLFFQALRIKMPKYMNAFLDGKRLTVYNRTQEATAQQLQESSNEEEELQSLTLVDHYIALLLTICIESGLLEALIAVIEEGNSTLNRKATLLLGEVLQMANRILPLQFAAQLQSLPRLFTEATDFSKPGDRIAALSALSSIDSLNRNQTKAVRRAAADNAFSSTAQHNSLMRGQRQVQQVKLRLGLQIEDKQFQQMIVDSGLLLHRDHNKWNYEVIVDLVEGPLLNPKRLDEAIRATKFARRLFSFFHPYNNRFSTVKRTRPNHKWVKLGCSLLSTMLSTPEGIRFLTEDKLLKQLLDCFNELDQYVGQPTAQPVFARDRLEGTLTYGYFEMIGTLSKHREGMKLMEKFKFFTCFYHLSEQRSRDDIIRIIIECFDYTLDAHPRIVLSKALTSSYMETRLYATHHLGRLLQEQPVLMDWGLQLMITQLYDTAMEVCDVAVMYLEEVCTDPVWLEKVVQLRPTLEHLGDVGHPLFMRFVSTSVGFQYLNQAQYIERELESWLAERNLLYVIEAETFVSKTIRPWASDTVEDYWMYDGLAPSHFLGELTKTPEGCELLKERGIVADFAEIVRLHGMEGGDPSVLTNLKSVLWALGNIGSTEGGLPFLEDEEIIMEIVDVAEQSPVLTIRGTCFFVIGLISSTRMGAEILEEFGWIATRTPLGDTTGLCLPNDVSRFVAIDTWERPDLRPLAPALPKLHGLESEIMTSIANLSNYVLAAGAMNNLKRIRTRHPKYFSSITLFHRALRTISTNHFQAPVRRFILDLFELKLERPTLIQLAGIEANIWRSAERHTAKGEAIATPSKRQKIRDEEDQLPRSEEDREVRRRSTSFPGLSPVTEPILHKLESRMRGVTIGDVDRQRVEGAKLMGPPMGLPVLEPITMAQEDFSAKERKVGWIDDDIVDGVEGAGPPSERASEKMELEESKEAEEISETIEEADKRRSNIEGQSKAKTHVRGFSVVPKDL
ncbi:sterility protein Ste20 [Cryptococcus neoformans c8]|nr:sterility protein Ste20 [Cryptococcus neoformans var. grubii AD1-83a]OXG46911.1 sterility protein Ste20 [Cryptococcus neoformans var. grubii MW-RSA1955]OXG50625.1 sterility protein Ste20 [Cryptococcus neoformans var. grubii CHC193]OXG57494.1 sterility protein Ste20 [Cryptococcus neoformans var. grubii c8]OXH02004.1 sterility protein Ste20 [Cryptococcus neoformans var. grubii A5-35-17]OXH03247.1 sterility protein Ste20 [Cryptococcus neoformans var. grubii A1-35-8]